MVNLSENPGNGVDLVMSVPLSGKAGLRQAQDVSDSLGESISAAEHVVIDLGALEGLDVSIAQILLAARKSAAAQGKSLYLQNASSGPVRDFLAGAGLLSPEGQARSKEETFWLGRSGAEGAV